MAKLDPDVCPACRMRYGGGRSLNAALRSHGGSRLIVHACPSCLAISAFRFRDPAPPEDRGAWEYETLSGGGDTRRFLERLESSSARGDLRAVHDAARQEEADSWRLRLPEALPFLRQLFVDGAELTGDTFGVADRWHGCVVLESTTRLPKPERYHPDPEAPTERLVSPGFGRIATYPKGFRAATPVFRKEGRSPIAVARALCLMAPYPTPDPGATFRLIAVPPDLMVPIS